MTRWKSLLNAPWNVDSSHYFNFRDLCSVEKRTQENVWCMNNPKEQKKCRNYENVHLNTGYHTLDKDIIYSSKYNWFDFGFMIHCWSLKLSLLLFTFTFSFSSFFLLSSPFAFSAKHSLGFILVGKVSANTLRTVKLFWKEVWLDSGSRFSL